METIKLLRHVYEMLEDEESRDIFVLRMEYLLTGDYVPIETITKKYIPELPASPYLSEQEIVPKANGRKIIIYGAGGDSSFYSKYWKKLGEQKEIIFCDKDISLQKNGFLGYDVVSPEQLKIDYSDAFVVIASTLFRREIKQNLLSMGLSNEQICEKVFPPLTIAENQYFEPEIISFSGESEVYIDGGSLDLSSVRELSYLCNIKKAYAFEPNMEHYEKCLEIKKNLGVNVEVFPYGLWSKEDTLKFEPRNDGGSHLTDKGKNVIKVLSLDDVIDPEEQVTFIKMDVEGAELEALKGCKHTILKNKPKLAICIYHKPEDMYEIPLYIKNLIPEYKLYIRAYSNRQFETVLYAII